MLYAMLCRCFPFERPEEKKLPRKDAMLKLMEVGDSLWVHLLMCLNLHFFRKILAHKQQRSFILPSNIKCAGYLFLWISTFCCGNASHYGYLLSSANSERWMEHPQQCFTVWWLQVLAQWYFATWSNEAAYNWRYSGTSLVQNRAARRHRQLPVPTKARRWSAGKSPSPKSWPHW